MKFVFFGQGMVWKGFFESIFVFELWQFLHDGNKIIILIYWFSLTEGIIIITAHFCLSDLPYNYNLLPYNKFNMDNSTAVPGNLFLMQEANPRNSGKKSTQIIQLSTSSITKFIQFNGKFINHPDVYTYHQKPSRRTQKYDSLNMAEK